MLPSFFVPSIAPIASRYQPFVSFTVRRMTPEGRSRYSSTSPKSVSCSGTSCALTW